MSEEPLNRSRETVEQAREAVDEAMQTVPTTHDEDETGPAAGSDPATKAAAGPDDQD